MTKSKSNQTLIAALITGIILLAALSGYLMYDRTQLTEVNNNQREEILEVEKIQAELEIQYEEALMTLDEMKTDNLALNALIDEQKAELGSQKKKINNLLWSQKKLDEAKVEIENLKTQTAQYIAEITSLKEENEFLNAKNVKLEEDKTMLMEDLNKEKEVTTELQTVQAKLVNEKTELEEINTVLAKKVDIASVIAVENVVAEGLRVKDSGKEINKKFARSVEKIRVCFDAKENLVANAGQEAFYVRIIDPLGETMAIEAAGSGVLQKGADGESVRYSKKGILNYQNSEVTACIDWAPGTAFAKGTYEIEVYNKGYLAGTGSVELK